ncbi:Radical SAM protein DVU1407 [Olavius algarvensis associated proteobacterium Delta 3]|nr:Radical SAM protein DVU1407 [Olavius algarvensis associated proteobacterium Delta 3]
MTRSEFIRAVVANPDGEIFDLDGYAAVGADGPMLAPLNTTDTISLPFGGELMMLPHRRPIVLNLENQQLECIAENPYIPGEPISPVAAFNSPGYVATHVCAYEAPGNASPLPLFSYGAVGWARGGFRSAAVRVEWERRQDLRLMPHDGVLSGIQEMRLHLPGNRLREHLENCALIYGCPAGKNFFLQRYEAPLPTSARCNARCLGCLSLQSDSDIPCSQQRIEFTPTAEEIAQVALVHLRAVDQGVVSFGQGCEGDPLLAAHVIEPAIKIIRQETRRGTINLNTNASRPEIISRLLNAGLDSLRVSLNSIRADHYNAYFRPSGYGFGDVLESIDRAVDHGAFVSINYLNIPGFTDQPEEIDALIEFLSRHRVHMIQWRNLNYDPQQYWITMENVSSGGDPIGVRNALNRIRDAFPNLKFGYFNPPKEKFKRVHRRIY